ncbi:putative FAS1 domain-containing protein [Helianthus annuus]|nr:putative FAS1 domain-containing protein [Helianthus annuus]KAJ0726155.1 putative FAS1 domain-containing protein [Helianthus annuus]KAJ0867222.1 putative FAS1 domain-containing protein [Helianthus annuus]
MAAKPLLFPVTLLLLLLPFTTALPPETIANAADTLSNSGYVAMSLTLNLLSTSLLSQTNSATIFTPPDSIFALSGQPPLSLLQLHISPLLFSLSSLRSLLPGTRIPTVSSNTYLTVTSPSFSDQISINNVNIIGSPVFDDGSLIIYSIENFFDPDSEISKAPVQIESFNSFNGCDASYGSGDKNYSFRNANNVLISRGYSVMASFLNLQLLGFRSEHNLSLTVFAPVDEVMVDYSGRFPDYASLFMRHVLNCRISWREFDNVVDRTSLSTYFSGFGVRVSRSGGVLMVNEVPVVFPDMYYSDWLVIHGVSEVFSVPEPVEDVDDSDGDFDDRIPSSDAAKEPDVPAVSFKTEF